MNPDSDNDDNNDDDIQQREMPSVIKKNPLIKPIALGLGVLSIGALALNTNYSTESSASPDQAVDEQYGTGINDLPRKYNASTENEITSAYKRNNPDGSVINNIFNITNNPENFDKNGNPIKPLPQRKNSAYVQSHQQPSQQKPPEVIKLENEQKEQKEKEKWARRASAKTTMYDAGQNGFQQRNTPVTNDLDNFNQQENLLRQQLMQLGGGQLSNMALAGSNGNVIGSVGNNPNTQFGRQTNARSVEMAMAIPLGNLDYTILEGKIIPCALENAIDSSLPGKVRCVISRNVYGESGRNVLIPQGATMVGEYNSSLQNGQYRIYTMWTRIITGIYDINIGSPGYDNLGRSGNAGYVDTHFWKKLGNATLLSVVGAGASNYGVEDTDQLNSNSAYRQQISENFSNQANNSLRGNASIPDTIHRDQGDKIIIMSSKDLDFSVLKNQQASR